MKDWRETFLMSFSVTYQFYLIFYKVVNQIFCFGRMQLLKVCVLPIIYWGNTKTQRLSEWRVLDLSVGLRAHNCQK